MTRLALSVLTALLAKTVISLVILETNSSDIVTEQIAKRTGGQPVWYTDQIVGSATLVNHKVQDLIYENAVTRGLQLFQHLKQLQSSFSTVQKAGDPKDDDVSIAHEQEYGWERDTQQINFSPGQQPDWTNVLDFGIKSGRDVTWSLETFSSPLGGSHVLGIVSLPWPDIYTLLRFRN